MCSVFGISRSGYYASAKRKEGKRRKEDTNLMPMIKSTFERGRATYGTRSIRDILGGIGIHISRRRTRRLMDQQGLYPQTAKAFRHGTTTQSKHPIPTPDLVHRNFSADAPNRVWTGDITEVLTSEGKLYLAIIEDLFSRLVVGWTMMAMKTVLLVQLAFRMACIRRSGELLTGCVFHSDKGSQYDCKDFRDELAKKQFLQSMGSTADCFDNAVTESAFSTIKSECLFGRQFDTRDKARSCIFDYIEAFYNRVRRHTTLGGMSPEEFECKWYGG
jgi:putative transposase